MWLFTALDFEKLDKKHCCSYIYTISVSFHYLQLGKTVLMEFHFLRSSKHLPIEYQSNFIYPTYHTLKL